MGGTDLETAELGAQSIQPRTAERESQLPLSSPDKKWNLGALESGPDGQGESKAPDSPALPHPPQFSTPTSPEKHHHDVVTYPEGGVRAWLVVFGSWCAILAALGNANTFGSFQSYFITHQLRHYSPSVVGWIFSVYIFLTFGGGLVIGPIFDKYGPKWLVLAGSFAVCLSMFLVGICDKYWQILLVFGFLEGVGSALLLVPSIAVVGHYFSKNRGSATGIAISSSALAGVAFPLLLENLNPKIGFAWSTRIIGFIYLCACFFACTLIRSRLPPGRKETAKPDIRIFKDTAFTLTVIAIFLLQWAYFVPIAYISSYALYHRFTLEFSYHVLVFLNVGSIFGRWLPGLTADKIGRYNSLILMSILTGVSVLGIWLPVGHTRAGLVAFAVTYGFTSGSLLTLTGVCVGQLCQTKNYGKYLATSLTVASIAFLTGVPIGGDLLGRDNGDYRYLIIFVGLCNVGAAAGLIVVRLFKTGWKLTAIY